MGFGVIRPLTRDRTLGAVVRSLRHRTCDRTLRQYRTGPYHQPVPGMFSLPCPLIFAITALDFLVRTRYDLLLQNLCPTTQASKSRLAMRFAFLNELSKTRIGLPLHGSNIAHGHLYHRDIRITRLECNEHTLLGCRGDLYLVYAADGQVGYFLGRRSQRRSGMSRVHPAPMRIEECQRRVRLGRLSHRAAGTLLLRCSFCREWLCL